MNCVIRMLFFTVFFVFINANAMDNEAQVRFIEKTIESHELMRLKDIINAAYFVAGKGLFLPSKKRIDLEGLKAIIERGELLGLWLDNAWRGCIYIKPSPYANTNKAAIFGMLAVENDEKYRSRHFGTLLVNKAEAWAKENGYTHMQLELLQPTDFIHEHRKKLEIWYERIGYEYKNSEPFDGSEFLCVSNYDFRVYEKKLP